jgi:hypothetical protein
MLEGLIEKVRFPSRERESRLERNEHQNKVRGANTVQRLVIFLRQALHVGTQGIDVPGELALLAGLVLGAAVGLVGGQRNLRIHHHVFTLG